jgi:IS4 transposase
MVVCRFLVIDNGFLFQEATRMLLGKRFEAFVDGSPVCVMIRGVLEREFDPKRVDAMFAETAQSGYTRELLFSTAVRLMSEVVLGVSPSVHAAYQDDAASVPVTVAAVYEKLKGIETEVSAELVRDSARQLAPIVRLMRGTVPPLLRGYRARILDGNHLAGTEHRIKGLRRFRAAALPGQALVVLDPELMLMIDVVPCEDAYAQERSLFDRVLPMVQAGDLWIDDRNFCTTGLTFGIACRQACFLVRQHANSLHWELVGKRKSRGRIETGKVFEQTVRLYDPQAGETLVARRITVELNEPTRDGEKEIHLITNLPRKDAGAKQIARLYAKRWTIERAFQDLTVALVCEINTLGYPKAALFGFCLALAAYNAVSLVKASLRAIHGHEKVESEVSWYYLCLHVSKVYAGMMIAIPAHHWNIFRRLDEKQLATLLKELAAKIDLGRFRKHRRGPKRPQPKKISGAKTKHVSTARILAKSSP